ncbi:HpcH/HpaI aldolase family protein [Antarctobacter heliothermus]|uniref:4-hydroxy-2-oxoheptanedioate aldolase n=1 Tax=Antarctobacter heliothermus TaxID=74033 RepID=A0A239EGP5_9RHOB|nr:aldolase/citrate lyase family protein [Antarctobacter heliothermus]SNS43448.1 4-hydroxy-2-oxoheptanedioate aldolase [Antarctobacter heliothermus]
MPSLKAKLQDPARRLTSVVCTIPSATVPQAIAASGVDCVLIDLEHGAVDYGSAHAMIAATAGTDCAPIVRIPENTDAHVKRALDLGAEGICFPLIRDVQDAEWAVRSLRYPPDGTRGFGPFIAQSRWATDIPGYARDVAPQMVCMPLIETVEAVDNIETICAVDGLDVLIVAGFDLSTALGISGQFNHPDYKAAVTRIETAAAAASVPLGTIAMTKAQADAAFAQGYRILAGFDLLWIRARAAELAGWAQG